MEPREELNAAVDATVAAGRKVQEAEGLSETELGSLINDLVEERLACPKENSDDAG